MIGFVFPGQGSQYVGMGKELAEAYPEAREIFALADRALNRNLTTLCFEGPADQLNQTSNTQPAILTASIAAHAVLKKHFPTPPQWIAGHSLGEYTALVAAAGISFEEAVRLVARRGELMQKAVPEGAGAMAAILGLNRSVVESLCKESSFAGVVAPANYNTPEQIVIAGERKAVEVASKKAEEAGAKKVVPLSVSVPSHCLLMEPAAVELKKYIEKVPFRDLNLGLVNNADARELRKSDDIKRSLIRQISAPLLWVDSILLMIDKGVTTFVEIGPGRVLSGLIKRINRQVEVFSVEDVQTLENTVKKLKG